MTIEEKQKEIIENFSLFDNWEDKYAYIIELGKKINSLEESYKTEENRIKGCQSNVWIYTKFENNLLYFFGDSDAVIVKGLVSLLLHVLSGHKPEDIANAKLFFIEEIGMQQHLSMTRSNGLLAMIKQLKTYGIIFQNK